MSRSAAVAYERQVEMPSLDEQADSWPGRGDSRAYRLLGDSGMPLPGPVPVRLVLDRDALPPSAQGNAGLQPLVDLPAYTSWYRRTTPGDHGAAGRFRA